MRLWPANQLDGVGYLVITDYLNYIFTSLLERVIRKMWNFIQYLSSVFGRGVNEIFALLRCYAAYVDSYLRKIRDNILLQSAKVNQSQEGAQTIRHITSYLSVPGIILGLARPLKLGPTGCPETSVNNYQSRCVTSQKSVDLKLFVIKLLF